VTASAYDSFLPPSVLSQRRTFVTEAAALRFDSYRAQDPPSFFLKIPRTSACDLCG
jgi:hypothetical protein